MRDPDWHAVLMRLIAQTHENEWVEFKCNNEKPDEIGEYLSAIANSAALHGKRQGYIIWGVEDSTRRIIGTVFKPRQAKVGNEELENWLAHHLTPRIDFRIHELTAQSRNVVLFEIPAAFHAPVRFKETEYVRVGSYKKKLKDHQEKERTLWTLFSRRTFEKEYAVEGASSEKVRKLIDDSPVKSVFVLDK